MNGSRVFGRAVGDNQVGFDAVRVETHRCVDAERTDLDAQIQQSGAVGQPLTAVALVGARRVRPA